MKHLFLTLILFALFIPMPLCAQFNAYDTLRVMTYNVLNYGFPSSQSCPTLASSNKQIWLRTILRYTQPDILGLEKMAASPATFTTDTIPQQILDNICSGCYGHTPYTNHSGYEKEDMLYYKTGKIGWLSTTTIYSADSNISDINLHRLYYKSPTLAQTHDTVYLNVILVHLESGSGNSAERATEIAGAMTWLNSHVTQPGNYIFMGDLNTQSSSESCFQQLVNSSNANTLFFDPVNQPGNWDNNSAAFANYLTQSTRTSDPGDCGATGGMDDRFDHILCTQPVIDGTDSLQYLDSTFVVIGQDGLHVNKSLIAAPQNEAAPDSIINALYYMSEHLPVMLQLAVGGAHAATGVDETKGGAFKIYPNPGKGMVTVSLPQISNGSMLLVMNTLGQVIMNMPLNKLQTQVDLSSLGNGVYWLQLQQNSQTLTRPYIIAK